MSRVKGQVIRPRWSLALKTKSCFFIVFVLIVIVVYVVVVMVVVDPTNLALKFG